MQSGLQNSAVLVAITWEKVGVTLVVVLTAQLESRCRHGMV